MGMQKLARWSFTHRRLVAAIWLLAVMAAILGSKVVGSRYRDDLKLPGTGSATAADLLHRAAPRAGDVDEVVFAVRTGSITDAVIAARIRPVLASISRLPHVSSVASPYANARQISADHTVAFATVTFDTDGRLVPTAATRAVISTARSAAADQLDVALNGLAVSETNKPSIGGAGFGIAVAAIVLFLAFGSITAMALPLVTALVSLGAGLGLIGMLSRAISMATFTTQLASLIGLGVGIDYAMFIVSRYRQSLLAGSDPEDAAATSVNTSGRAVLFAGATVCIALLGMFALGVSIFYGVAIAAGLAVLITLLAALTLQPALLGFFGRRVLPRRLRAAGPIAAQGDSARWSAWAMRLRRSPVTFAAAGTLALVVLAIPLLNLRLGFSDASNDPPTSTTRQAYDLLARGFGPGFNGPLQIVGRLSDPADAGAFSAVLSAAARQPGVAAVSAPSSFGSGVDRVEAAQIYPTTAPQDPQTADLVTRLRDDVIPAAAGGSGMQVAVGGVTAVDVDFSHRLAQRMPLFVAVVVVISALLLAMVFRSVLIPLVAAVMNLASVAAAFGVVTAVFNWGWLGIARTGPIEPFIPVIIFAILFGLSMDYEVFLVSRMYELWHHTRDNAHAVTSGLVRTGRTITAAAAIMFAVFASFVLGDDRIVKLFGLGLASAVLIDALIVRTLLLPAIMLLIGRRNWTLPRVLDRLIPTVPVEPPDEDAARPEAAFSPAGR